MCSNSQSFQQILRKFPTRIVVAHHFIKCLNGVWISATYAKIRSDVNVFLAMENEMNFIFNDISVTRSAYSLVEGYLSISASFYAERQCACP